ncbi:MAG: L,D-transpeptidase, partial [Bacteroidota bacterium]
MDSIPNRVITACVLLGLFLLNACVRPPTTTSSADRPALDSLRSQPKDTRVKPDKISYEMQVPQHIRVKDYFPFMDSIVATYDSLVDYSLTEHLLVWANPWIIDTLASTDYYQQAAKDTFVYDQREIIVLSRKSILRIPTQEEARTIQQQLSHTVVDVNIPEFKLRIYRHDSVLHTFPARVGRDERKYLETAGRVVDLRTPIGSGKIVRIERDPFFVDPVSGEPFTTTRRDDGKRTMMPQIPWLEPEINGIRYGSMIHPTTNPSTLGKAYSNGCVGTPEGAAWIIYYYAPVGTRVNFRYDLEVTDEWGNSLQLDDIYELVKKSHSSSLVNNFP